MTLIQAKGGYSGKDKTMIYIVVNRFQITRLRNIVQQIDPLAYTSICDIADIFNANIDENNINLTDDNEEHTDDIEEHTDDIEERTDDIEERTDDIEERTDDIEERTDSNDMLRK